MENDKIQHYCLSHSEPEPEILRHIYRQTHLKTIYPRMCSGHLQGRFLSLLSKLTQPTTILEIGTFTGYATLCLAEGLKPEGILHTIEINPELEPLLLTHFEMSDYYHQIQIHFGDACQQISTLEGNFDMVFMDADKSQYPTYFHLIRERISPGGLLIADNVLWGGKVVNESASDSETKGILEFNTLAAGDKSFEVIMLPLRDGISVLRKK